MSDPHHILILTTLARRSGHVADAAARNRPGTRRGHRDGGHRPGAGRLAGAPSGRLDGRRHVPGPRGGDRRLGRRGRHLPQSALLRDLVRPVAVGHGRAVLFIGAQFLAVATVVVYAGAILVTFLFVLMLAQPEGKAAYDRVSWEALDLGRRRAW